MTNHSHSTTPLALSEPGDFSEPAGALLHAALLVAMMLVSAAIGTLAFKSLAISPTGAIGIALAVLLISLGAHIFVSSRAAAPARRPMASARTSRPRARRTPPVLSETPSQEAPAHHEADADVLKPVEPSDLALDLLRRAAEPQPTPPALAKLAQRPVWDEAGGIKAMPDFGFGAEPMPSFSPEVAPQETELQRVERLVKRLADEVNAKEQISTIVHSPAAAPVPPPLPPVAAEPVMFAPPALPAAPEFPIAPPPVPTLDPAAVQLAFDLSTAIAALAKWPEPVEAPKIDELAMERREAVLSALHAQRIDVFLEPILGLNDQRPQHYEVSIGLKGANGELLNLAEAASSLSGTGLLPLIDSARITKAAQLARRLAERGKTGSVLTEFSAESLADRDTQADLTGRPSAGSFPGQLVLMLPQAQVRLFSAADWQTLARLGAAGFGFALTDVTSLDMDFAALAAGGFRFARLDAEAFLVGLPTSDGLVEPSGICRHISQCGLGLIVGGIVDDVQLAKIFGFGVLFGQGQLFGGPRPVGAPAPRLEASVASAAE